jgi:hypothetical protein
MGSRRRLFRGQGGERAAPSDDDIELTRNQFSRERGEPLGLSSGIPVFPQEVAALDVAKATQSLEEAFSGQRIGARQVERQVAYANYPVRRVRLSGERRGEEAAGQAAHERPPVHHSIT